ncbi:MAG: tRNA pseudouridine(55) synthase TruB [Chloroflexi bacterium]|nr:tRNA pseudouridine(55) synthase TruB [Chloroflexota bacterium]
MSNQELCGILNINKPRGVTSHDVVARVRKITGQRKVGHAGTLDPLATGVLLLCLGQATRVAEYLAASDKVYRTRLRLGISTDTYDAEGQITSQSKVAVSRDQVEQALQAFTGIQEQMPPMYSAIKRDGIPLYRLARRGQVVPRQMRKVEIHDIHLLIWEPPELEIEISCSKGTYIRSLVHDIGQRLGCGAHLMTLTRIASGQFRVEDAITLEELEQACARGTVVSLLHPLDMALQSFPAVTVDLATERRIVSGQRVRLSNAIEGTLCRAYAADGRLLALLRLDREGLWQPHKVFAQGRGNEDHP